MNEMDTLLIAAVSGAGLGLLFFGGLWWTVRHSLAAKNAAFWILLSSQLRTMTVVTGFYFIGRNDWHRLVVAIVAFFLTRAIIGFWLRRQAVAPVAVSGASSKPHPDDWLKR